VVEVRVRTEGRRRPPLAAAIIVGATDVERAAHALFGDAPADAVTDDVPAAADAAAETHVKQLAVLRHVVNNVDLFMSRKNNVMVLKYRGAI
jgi:hypothetical protein